MGIVRSQKVEFTTSVPSELVRHSESARREMHRRGGAEYLTRPARLLLLPGVNPVLEQVIDINGERCPVGLRIRHLREGRCGDQRLYGQT